jgi:hypothetical protein
MVLRAVVQQVAVILSGRAARNERALNVPAEGKGWGRRGNGRGHGILLFT